MKRYAVVLTYRGRMSGASCKHAGTFRRLNQAIKERDRQNDRAWFKVDNPGDLLRKGSFKYRWRVWDCGNRRWAA